MDCEFSLPFVCPGAVNDAGYLLDGLHGLGDGGQIMGCQILGVASDKPACMAATTAFCTANGGQVMPMGCDSAQPATPMELKSSLPVLGGAVHARVAQPGVYTAQVNSPHTNPHGGPAPPSSYYAQLAQPGTFSVHSNMLPQPYAQAGAGAGASAARGNMLARNGPASRHAIDNILVKNKTKHRVQRVTVNGAPGLASVYAPQALKKNGSVPLNMPTGPWVNPGPLSVAVDGPDLHSTGTAYLDGLTDKDNKAELPYAPGTSDGKHRVTVKAMKDKKKSKKTGMTVYALVIELH